ncbi:XdhC/CoxI family protein [Flavobacterium sp. GSP27]|uniref:XdhC family protein n=1 Tax=unclassified Flavobacterium TaxID=196869 RepID=UPI000F82B0AE|nr:MULTISPECIES: XdhC/CoxI family protein [unclassified Flavobacterium]RTY80147.1 XdhC/CoxI family protein [Flavobacterium sp. LS1P28]RTY96627.1 XdhC/CoxI family protein [Flavobacterium sp. GSN2]RTZ03359.1 XdhC/CoxI family protein [Flavobacterium sp. RSP49]RTZ10843.1 XdhC/CoxI family protein [Flavobacterium sp. GSP27]
MKEVTDILKAYSAAKASGKKTALATVVKVEGSSYRQPGARMLVTEDGILTGAISGGCLEGDALRKALLAIHQKQNKLITYDTSDESDSDFGVQLGCNGIVHILFEYIDECAVCNPIYLLEQSVAERKEAVVLTLFSLERNTVQIGTVLVYREDLVISQRTDLKALHVAFKEVLYSKSSIIKKIQLEDHEHEALIEYIPLPVSLVLAGAGNDAQPLVKMANLLGWEVLVGDGRATHSTAKRFPEAKQILVTKPLQLVENSSIDSRTFFVLMTHNYKYDLEVLKLLLETDCMYIGILGPKTKLNRMFDDLSAEGIVVTKAQLDRIYGPIGLDIGAETSEEIALSVVAEIKAVMEGKTANSLKHKKNKIHPATNGIKNT